MTKHFCDKCGNECPSNLMWDVDCEARSFVDDTETSFHFEVCSVCMLKLRKLMEEKEEVWKFMQ